MDGWRKQQQQRMRRISSTGEKLKIILNTHPHNSHTHTHITCGGGQPGIGAIPDCCGSCVGRVQGVCVGVDDEFCALTTRSTLLFKNTTINHLKYKILLRVISQMKIFPRDPTEIRSDQVTIMCGRGTV